MTAIFNQIKTNNLSRWSSITHTNREVKLPLGVYQIILFMFNTRIIFDYRLIDNVNCRRRNGVIQLRTATTSAAESEK